MESKDEGEQGPKIVPLFPSRPARASAPSEPAVASEGDKSDELTAVATGVKHLLKGAEQASQPGPDPTHRNAVRCPQCDHYTWRETDRCIHCGKDLAAHAAQLAATRRANWQGLAWPSAILSWGISMLCVYAIQHQLLPTGTLLGLRYVVYGIVVVNALGFWIASMNKVR